MALEEQMKAPPEQKQESLTDDEENDLKIATLFAEKLIDEGGIDVVDQAIKESSDPGQVIGQFLMQLASQLGENLPEEMKLSPRIFFAEGGWVEQVSDYLQETYKIDRKIMDRAEIYIATSADKMKQGAAQQTVEGQPPAGGPVPAVPEQAPQGGMV